MLVERVDHGRERRPGLPLAVDEDDGGRTESRADGRIGAGNTHSVGGVKRHFRAAGSVERERRCPDDGSITPEERGGGEQEQRRRGRR